MSLWMRGLTLLELLISIALGSLFSLAIVGVYLQSKQQFTVDEAMARMQENGRYSLFLLKRELAHAGFYAGSPAVMDMAVAPISSGCVSGGNWALNPRSAVELVNNFDPVAGERAITGRGTALRCIPAQHIEPLTDLVSVKRTAGKATVRNGEYTSGAVVKNGQWYLRTGDYGGEASWYYHKNGGLPVVDLASSSGLDYWEFHARIFYIRKFSSLESDGIPSLCIERLGGGLSAGTMATRCLVEGVEDMQIQFGVDSDWDGIPDRFIDSSTVPRSGATVAVRIFLLLRSLDRIPGYRDSKTYTLGSKSLTPNDDYLRRVFSVTVKIRNPVSTIAANQEAIQ